MLEAEAEAEAEEESDGEAEEESDADPRSGSQWERRCRFRYCTCPWLSFPPTRRVAPGIDYVDIPDADAADRSPAWSLLVAVSDGDSSSLQLSRLRVARSGRILGRTDDVLEVFHKIVLAKPPDYGFEACAVPLETPDGSSLLVVSSDGLEQPQGLQLTLQPLADTKESPMPEIQGTTSDCMPISADGHIWALSACMRDDDIYSFSVVTRRLVPEPGGGRWELVGDPFTSQLKHYMADPLWGSGFLQGSPRKQYMADPPWGGELLQGYAVLPDTNLILVSFRHFGLFLTFAPRTGRWTQVLTATDETSLKGYLPIFGRGVYVEQHSAVYMHCDNIIYAYKLTYQKDDHGALQLKLDLPFKIDSVCPFVPEKGYGFLTRLAGDLMCSVWISLAQHDPCPCDKLHAIVTTFHLQRPAKGGIKVLHSTYRQLDIEPDPEADQKFCFLQEYEDQGSPVLQQREEEQEDLTSSQHVDELLNCCRIVQELRSIPRSEYRPSKGGPAAVESYRLLHPEKPSSTIPPLVPSHTKLVDPASGQDQVCSSGPAVPVKPATTTIKKDLFIICQAGSRSVIYQMGAMDDDVKSLVQCYVEEDGDLHFLQSGSDLHFFESGSKIHAVSSIKDGVAEFSLNKDCLSAFSIQRIMRHVRRPTAGPFVMVIRVGTETIALTDTLQVYHQTQFNSGYTAWLRYTTDDSKVVSRRVVISGYVAVNDDSFIVYDAVSCSCLLFKLGAKQWRVVMPYAAFKEDLPTSSSTIAVLNGRCVFVDGFIYTCRNAGLAAYELLDKGHSVYLSKPIVLALQQLGEDMCLDFAGKDVDTGSNLFYVVQGGNCLRNTTVKVKTKMIASNKMKPVGIELVGCVIRTPHTETIDARCCFAVS